MNLGHVESLRSSLVPVSQKQEVPIETNEPPRGLKVVKSFV